jgi:site-specific recombinase XerD
MFAWELYEASGHNIHMVSTKLGHKSIATTQIYLQHLKEPCDDHSDLLARQLGLTF